MSNFWAYLAIGIVIGLVVGVPTTYYFSHRVSSSAPTVKPNVTSSSSGLNVFTIGAAGTLKFSFGAMLKEFANIYHKIPLGTPLFKGSEEVAHEEKATNEFSAVASADTTSIPSILFPATASYEIAFGTTQMVIIVDLQTKVGKEVYALWKKAETLKPYTSQWNQTWKEIFSIIALNPSSIIGVSNPFTDPSGYQAQCVLKLAGLTFFGNSSYLYNNVYKNPKKYYMRNTEIDLLSLMATNNSINFILSSYLSNAMPQVEFYRSKDVNITYITLPPLINLGNLSYVPYYHRVNVTWTELGTSKTFACNPVVYTITIPNKAPNKEAGVDFILLLFSPKGQTILKHYGIDPIVPGIVYGNYSGVPAQVRPFVKPVNQTTLISIFK